MVVLSLFDGIGGAIYSLVESLGVKVKAYITSEIEPKAEMVTNNNTLSNPFYKTRYIPNQFR